MLRAPRSCYELNDELGTLFRSLPCRTLRLTWNCFGPWNTIPSWSALCVDRWWFCDRFYASHCRCRYRRTSRTRSRSSSLHSESPYASYCLARRGSKTTDPFGFDSTEQRQWTHVFARQAERLVQHDFASFYAPQAQRSSYSHSL